MPKYTYPIGPDGPVVPVMIGLDDQSTAVLAQAGLPVPPPLHGFGLLDTGSDVTIVAPRLLRPYQYIPGGGASTTTTGGAIPVRLTRISLSIIPPLSVTGPLIVQANLVAAEMVQAVPNIDVIVGRDVMMDYECDFEGPAALVHIIF